MASIRTENNGRKSILVVLPNKKRKTIRLLTKDQGIAAEASRRIQELADRAEDGEARSKALRRWLAGQPAKVRERLEGAELVDVTPEKRKQIEVADAATEAAKRDRENPTIKALTDRFLKANERRKDSTYRNYKYAVNNLLDHFDHNRRIRSINALDAEEFITWLETQGGRRKDKQGKCKKELSKNTVRRRTGTIFQIFKTAVRAEQLTKNPFAEFSKVVRPNPAKDHYVTIGEIEACLDAAPDAEWRAIIALCRFAGLRNPSETTRLRWIDVDTVNWERMLVYSPKTEHHEGMESRVVPIFPDLKPYLQEAWNEAEEGSEFVVAQGSCSLNSKLNMRNRMERILTAAKIKCWPNLFNNMRGSCITDLLIDTENIKQVAAWSGNSPEMILKHYQKITPHLEQIVLARVEARTKRALKTAHESGTVGDGKVGYRRENGSGDSSETRETCVLSSEGTARIDG